MRYIIESVSEMNFNYLYLDEKCLSYNQLLEKFVISNDQFPQGAHGKERNNISSNTNTLANNKRHENFNASTSANSYTHPTLQNADSYYNVKLPIIN
jgi:hypothetical protein